MNKIVFAFSINTNCWLVPKIKKYKSCDTYNFHFKFYFQMHHLKLIHIIQISKEASGGREKILNYYITSEQNKIEKTVLII